MGQYAYFRFEDGDGKEYRWSDFMKFGIFGLKITFGSGAEDLVENQGTLYLTEKSDLSGE